MDSILIGARVVIPMILMICLGVLLRITKITDRETMKRFDQVIFRICLPFMGFCNIYNSDFSSVSAVELTVYCSLGIVAVFVFCMLLIPKFIHEPPTAAAFGQALLRANYLVFGIAVAKTLYGDEILGLIMLVGMVVIPVYNICLTVFMEHCMEHRGSAFHTLIAVLRSPMIIATGLAAIVKLCGMQIPDMIMGVLDDVGGLTAPLCFISMGVGLSFTAGPKLRLAFITALFRLILIPVILISGGIAMGFRGGELCILLVLFASPTAVASYPAAVAMGADGEYAGQTVAVSLVSCMCTIFIWICALNAMHLL